MGGTGSKPASPPPLPKQEVQRVEILGLPTFEAPSMEAPRYSMHMSEYQKLCDGYMVGLNAGPGGRSSAALPPAESAQRQARAVAVRAVPEGPFYPPKPNRRHLRYALERIIGKGSYGKVYLATEQVTGQMLAVKQVSIGSCSAEALQSLDAETRILCNLQHPNIVRVYDVEVDREAGVLSLAMEYVSGGNLAALAKRIGGVPELLCRRYVRQLVDALAYMHLHRVAHLDLKCSNVMLGRDGEVKLVDFGTATRLCRAELGDDLAGLEASAGPGQGQAAPQGGSARVRIGMKGSPYWVAPECVRYPVYDVFKADVWSLGCLIIEMLDSYPPFFQFKQIPVLLYHVATLAEPPPLPSMISSTAADFLRKCLCLDPKARANIFELASHPWIADINLGLGLRPLQPYTREEYYLVPDKGGLEAVPEEDSQGLEGSGSGEPGPEEPGEASDAAGRAASRSSGSSEQGEGLGEPGGPPGAGSPASGPPASGPPGAGSSGSGQGAGQGAGGIGRGSEAGPGAPGVPGGGSGALGTALGVARVSSPTAPSPASAALAPAPSPRTALPEPVPREELAAGRVEDDPTAMAVLAETRAGGGPDGPGARLLRRDGEGPAISSFRLTASVLFDVLLGAQQGGAAPLGGTVARTLSARRLWARSSVPPGLGPGGEEASLGLEELDEALFACESSSEEGEAGGLRGPRSARGRPRRADRAGEVFGELAEPEWLARAHDELFAAAEAGGAF